MFYYKEKNTSKHYSLEVPFWHKRERELIKGRGDALLPFEIIIPLYVSGVNPNFKLFYENKKRIGR
ncbi:hypothetical protein GCM10019815_16920 [Pediococcus damnosus]